MSIAAGTKLGPYEIVAAIGAGGMGEVYRARDTKLKRDVALKVLPEAFAHDPERLARFEREAEVLASLNHPNIAAIYGVVDNRALVMELVEGIEPKGPLPFDEAWHIASQMVAALEYAHDKGIVHRDLKPANIKVTPDGVVKLLDFGLAKAFTTQREASPATAENSPTLTINATEVGVILGTAAYMAPEQAKGKTVDKRADIWSFGVVLYELLTGERLFKGEDVSETLVSVLRDEPDLAKVPAKARKLLRLCLQKDPKKRLRDIGDAASLIDDATENSNPSRRSRLPWATAAIAIILAVALVFLYFRRPIESPRLVKFSLPLPNKTTPFEQNLPALSPDGRHLAFVVAADSRLELWVRDLDSLSARPLPGTEDARYPFWSSDSRSIAFFASGKLKKIELAGGSPVTLCDASATARGGSWSPQGVIVFAPAIGSGLFRVSASGGEAKPLIEVDASRGENGHRYPWFLPDGRHFFYTARNRDLAKSTVYVADLESKERHAVATANSNAVYAEPGYLVFARGQTLMAQPFDARTLQTTADPQPIAEQVSRLAADSRSQFSVSRNGVLAYVGGSNRGSYFAQLTWFDRAGKENGTVGTAGNFIFGGILSPDGTTVTVDRLDEETGLADIWLHDLKRGAASRFTFGPQSNQHPVWSSDGSRIAYRSDRSSGAIYERLFNATAEDHILDKDAGYPQDWSRDGRYLIEWRTNPKTNADIWVLPLFGDRKPFPYLRSEFNELWAKLSPNGQWLAYDSDETKHFEVYVQTFPNPGGKLRISINGGHQPIWSRDGKELFFIGADRNMMAVEIKATGAKFEAGAPRPLFDSHIGSVAQRFDVDNAGRFLIPVGVDQADAMSTTVVLNWTAALKR